MNKNQVPLYTSSTNRNCTLKRDIIYNKIKIMKYLGINLTKDVPDHYGEK